MPTVSVEVSEKLWTLGKDAASDGADDWPVQIGLWVRIGAAMTHPEFIDEDELSFLLGTAVDRSGTEDPHMAMVRYETQRQLLAERIGALIRALDVEEDAERRCEIFDAIQDLYVVAHRLRVGGTTTENLSRSDSLIETVDK